MRQVDYPRHEKMPECVCIPLGQIRVYRRTYVGGYSVDTLESLFEDGFGKRFWAPVPIVVEAVGEISVTCTAETVG